MSVTMLVIPSNRMDRLAEFFRAWKGRGGWDRAIVIEDAPQKTLLSAGAGESPLHYSHAEIGRILGDDAWIISRKDSACRCFGFLAAYHLGADRVITLDDDCWPLLETRDFAAEHDWAMTEHKKWVTSVPGLNPRGMPYKNRGKLENVVANVGLWTGNPDIDAPHSRVDMAARQQLDYDGKFMANWAPPNEGNWIVPHGQFVPLCGMNLCLERQALPLAYFPLMGEESPYARMDDIWFGVIFKHCCDALGWHISVGDPFVEHRRASDPFINLVKEAPGIAANEEFWEMVTCAELPVSRPAIDTIQQMGWHFENIIKEADGEYYISRLGKALQVWARLFSERPAGL